MYDCSIHCGLSLLMCIPGLFNEQCAEYGQCVQVFRLGIIWVEGLWVLWLSHVCLPCVIIVCISGLSTALSSALHLCIVHSIIQCIVPEYCPEHCPQHCLVIMLNQVQKGGVNSIRGVPSPEQCSGLSLFCKIPIVQRVPQIRVFGVRHVQSVWWQSISMWFISNKKQLRPPNRWTPWQSTTLWLRANSRRSGTTSIIQWFHEMINRRKCRHYIVYRLRWSLCLWLVLSPRRRPDRLVQTLQREILSLFQYDEKER